MPIVIDLRQGGAMIPSGPQGGELSGFFLRPLSSVAAAI
ncbi:hypothetical protein GWL_26640 [Herbaspirillum sp. GW103]|nr:hypothetical protein GWL_26640 [Herbaspirillum sp. GW103]